MSCAVEYDKPITIQRIDPSAGKDAGGHVDKTSDASWIDYERAYARVVSKGGREFWRVAQLDAGVTHCWTAPWTRSLADATPDMRLIHDGLVYEIISVMDINLDHTEVEIRTERAI